MVRLFINKDFFKLYGKNLEEVSRVIMIYLLMIKYLFY